MDIKLPLRVSRIFLAKISIIAADGRLVAAKSGEITPEDSEAFRYLVAAANACAGLPVWELEQGKDEGLIRTIRRRVKAEKQRDDLLAELKSVIESMRIANADLRCSGVSLTSDIEDAEAVVAGVEAALKSNSKGES